MLKTRAAPASTVAEYKRRQAPPGVKITRAKFRPRPPLSDHQRLSRPVMTNDNGSPGRGALRAVAHRAHACRQCPHGAAQLAVRAQACRPLRAALSTIPTATARPRPSATPSPRTCAGSASSRDLTVRQSERFDRLWPSRRAAARRRSRLYPCYETPQELELRRKRQLARGAPPIYDRAALQLDASRSPAARSGEGGGRIGASCWRPARWPGTTSSAATQEIDTATLSDPVLVRERRQLSLHAAIGRRRHRSRHHPRHPRRGPCRQHRGADPDVRGARGQAAAIRPSQPADRRRWPGAVEAARLAVDRRHARAGDRGDGGGERCGAARDLGVGSPGRRL